MVYLNTNTANQYAWLSLDEGRQYFNVAFTYYLLVLTYEMTGEELAQVVEVINENERVTKIRLTTVGLVDAGKYTHYHFIYIDADHTTIGVLVDAELSWRLLEVGGIMAFDDYTWGQELPPHLAPALGIDLFLERHEGEYETLEVGQQYWIRRIK